jgi:anti-sigma factor RsiW
MSPPALDLTCRQLVELVTDYFEDALDPADRARFEAHVAGCPGCDAYLAQMRTTLEVVGATAALDARPEVSALLEAFRDWKRRSVGSV